LIGLVLLGLRFPLLNPPYLLEVVQLLFGGEVLCAEILALIAASRSIYRPGINKNSLLINLL
jgi:hypothetical protein